MSRLALSVLAALSWTCAASAAETGGCGRFAWNLEAERALLAAPQAAAVASGTNMPGSPAALRLALRPLAEAALPSPPERASRAGGTLAGYVTLRVPAAGLYRVSLTGPAWIDVVQGGGYLKSEAFSGVQDCPGLRKSVRFRLEPGVATIQLSGSPEPSIGIVVSAEP